MATAATTPRRRPLGTEATKTPRLSAARSRPTGENLDPNLPTSIFSHSPQKQPPSSSCKPKKPLLRSPNPPPLPLERKFIVVKKNLPKKKAEETHQDRQRAAYESLRASQDGFFKNQSTVPVTTSPPRIIGVEDGELVMGDVSPETGEVGGTVKVRKMRSKLMEEAMSSLPEQGCGMVVHLVKAFESILSISKSGEEGESRRNADNCALPGLLMPPSRAAISTVPCSSSGEFFGLRGDSRLCASLDGSIQSSREGFDNAASGGGGRRSRRNSSGSMGNRRKKLGVTSLRPFKLRTEQRGRLKEEYFLKKVKEMLMEEEKRRIPQAQSLPWTTDEPECLVKPVVKESTEPVDIILHSDIRAVERAEFDQYVSEKIALAELKRLELERQHQLEEEEQIRRLRKELVPRAQPMPDFHQPFVPKRSQIPRTTIPREPRFRRVRTHKPCVPVIEEIARGSRIIGNFKFCTT